jgi:acyl-[acyl carrier protein]--UDP-N-acetylglucosamine O-acyltransferase
MKKGESYMMRMIILYSWFGVSMCCTNMIADQSVKAPRPIDNQIVITESSVEDCTCNVLTVVERAYFLDDVTIEGTVHVEEKVKVDELTVYDDATIEHNLSVGNDLEVDDDLSVGDNATIDGNVTIGQNIDIVGDITVAGTIFVPTADVCDLSVDCSFVTGPTATASIGTES